MEEPEKDVIPFYVPVDPHKLKEIARKDLGETEELKKECLEQLRRLIKDHQVTCDLADDFLLRFLRTKKFNLPRSFETLRNFMHHRRILHKNLSKLPPELPERCIRLNIYGVLPYRDAQDRFICFFRPGIWNRNICSTDELVTVFYLLTSCFIEMEFSQVTGSVILLDMKSVPLTHLVYVVPYLNRLRSYLFNSLTARYCRIHVFTNSIIYKAFFPVISQFLPTKIVQKIVFYEEVGEPFFEHVPRNILPDEFGGTLGPLNCDKVVEMVMDFCEKLKKERHYFQNDS